MERLNGVGRKRETWGRGWEEPQWHWRIRVRVWGMGDGGSQWHRRQGSMHMGGISRGRGGEHATMGESRRGRGGERVKRNCEGVPLLF